jgi:hypothetical protein
MAVTLPIRGNRAAVRLPLIDGCLWFREKIWQVHPSKRKRACGPDANAANSRAMQSNWRVWLRKTHLYLGVFFSPLLLFFLITGCWQTVVVEQQHEKTSYFHNLMNRLSTVHTDDCYLHGADAGNSHLAMKILVVTMVVALILSIVLGLWLAWIAPKGKWLALLAFLLGIAVPVVILYLN